MLIERHPRRGKLPILDHFSALLVTHCQVFSRFYNFERITRLSLALSNSRFYASFIKLRTPDVANL